MATDTTVNNLIINKLTKAQYEAIASPSDTELYLVPDEIDNVPTSGSDNPVTSGGVYTALGNKQDTLVSGTSIKTVNNNSLLGSGNISIPSGDTNVIETVKVNGTALTPDVNKAVDVTVPTESTVSGWGFTKNSGTYSKPSGGIPATDLASAVQTSLGKADTALQSFTESDPIFTASAAAGITSSDISNWNSKTSNVGTITGITMNGASKGTSGVVDLGTVITAHQDISGKADKSEMGVSTSGDQTTITLKSGTSATVINAHQSLSSKQDTLVSGTNIKTVNGNSILGSGNLSTLAPIVNHGYTDTTFALTPNVFHIWEDVSSLTLTLSAPSDNTVMAEYAFQFESGTTATALSYPSTISWDDKVGELVPDSGKIYQVSIVNNIGLWVSINS